MKNFKTAFHLATLIIAIVIGTTSCENNNTKDTKEVAEDHNDAKFDKNDNEKDAQFLVNAAEISMEEISLGQLAQQKGSTNHVKELGKMMEESHTKSLAELTALAQTKSISLPTSETENSKEAYKNLNDKSGNDFGKEYSSMMVKGHKKAIELFEKASTDCTDPDIKAWAAATLPILRTHLDRAMVCEKQCEKM
jgi:putative membrane protein